MSEAEVLPSSPRNLGSAWRYIPLGRTPNGIRRPMLPQPENLRPDASPKNKKLSDGIWNGLPADWDAMSRFVRDGVQIKGMDCREVGIFPAPSGLVILDCDVKYQYTDQHGTFTVDDCMAGWIRRSGRGVEVEELRGVDDLRRVVEQLGHSMQELNTFSVETKSGGLHLYFAENPRFQQRTRGHRDGWRVDIIAHNGGSDRSWAAAPPTPGYRVVDDVPVIELPDWLAVWLSDGLPRTKPLGGVSGVRLNAAREQALSRLKTVEWTPGMDLGELVRHYEGLILQTVTLANQYGGWNSAIYQATHDLLECGNSPEAVTSALLHAAQPWDDRERRRAEATIRSAINKNQR